MTRANVTLIYKVTVYHENVPIDPIYNVPEIPDPTWDQHPGTPRIEFDEANSILDVDMVADDIDYIEERPEDDEPPEYEAPFRNHGFTDKQERGI
jgi:hypothetical protein